MPASSRLLALSAFAAAGALAAGGGVALVRALEGLSAEAVEAELAEAGHGWASVLADGLQVVLEGEAPSESARFRAIAAAGAAVDASRVIDNMRVADAAGLPPPSFAVEILRGAGGVSMIGLVPSEADRERLAAAAARAASAAGGDAEVVDLLAVAAHPAPEGWDASLDLALRALPDLARARLSVAPGALDVEAVADTADARRAVEASLLRLKPEAVSLSLDVSAPRPVIAPFTLRFGIDADGAAFAACSADTEGARAAILAAARAAGAEGPIDCRVGLGSPSPLWGEAAARAVAAVAEMGGGSVTFSDADVLLRGPEGVDPALFDRVAADLGGALPPVFAFEAQRPQADGAVPAAPPLFRATLSEDGAVRLAGPVPDARALEMARAFAQARFGAEAVTLAARVAPDGLPPGWSLRVLAGVEALGRLGEGEVRVTPDLLALEGRTGDADAQEEIAARAIATLGADAALDLDVAYDEALDPIAGLPTPEECLQEIEAVTARAKITFDPGSDTISAAGEPVVEAVAAVLRSCGDLRLRIAGHTDGQGSEDGNLRLSQARAEAVLAALRAERVPVGGFEAVGFGEARPVAPNDTDAGREANRRIEFSLVGAPEGEEGGDGTGDGGEGAAALPPAPPLDGPAPPSRPAPDPGPAVEARAQP